MRLVTIIGTIGDLLAISRAHGIMRRYFVVNGFDGALTMLGIITGFRVGGQSDATIALSACIGAAIALGFSGLSSAYISESAERRRALRELEDAMITDLSASAHGRAARLAPLAIAIVNGLAPLVISLVITLPLWSPARGLSLPWSPLNAALGLAFAVIFLLGVYLGRISGKFWLYAGAHAVLIAVLTIVAIILLSPQP